MIWCDDTGPIEPPHSTVKISSHVQCIANNKVSMYTHSEREFVERERDRERDLAYTVVFVFRMIVVEIISIEKERRHKKKVPMRERGEGGPSTHCLLKSLSQLTNLALYRAADYTPYTWNIRWRWSLGSTWAVRPVQGRRERWGRGRWWGRTLPPWQTRRFHESTSSSIESPSYSAYRQLQKRAWLQTICAEIIIMNLHSWIQNLLHKFCHIEQNLMMKGAD